jgi:integrase
MARAKRAHGTGSISTKPRPDGRYEARLVLPDGRRRSIYGSTFDDAERKLAIAREQVARTGTLPEPGRVTIADLVERWLAWAAVTLAPATVAGYRARAKHHILPVIGDVRLARVGTAHVQLVIAEARARDLAPSTLRDLRAVTASLLQYAVDLDLIPRTPARGVRTGRVDPPEVPVLAAADLRHLLAAFDDVDAGAALATCLRLGLRVGEVRGLRWRDVDFASGTIYVRHGIRIEGRTVRFMTLKTATARRSLPISDALAITLRTHRAAQNETRLQQGAAWRDHELVFDRGNGLPITRQRLVIDLTDACRAAGVPRLRPHDLRRLCATWLAITGAPVGVAMRLLGHANSRTTIEVYQRVSETMLREAVSELDHALEA